MHGYLRVVRGRRVQASDWHAPHGTRELRRHQLGLQLQLHGRGEWSVHLASHGDLRSGQLHDSDQPAVAADRNEPGATGHLRRRCLRTRHDHVLRRKPCLCLCDRVPNLLRARR